MPKPGTRALHALPAVEQASVLGVLLQAHPDQPAEAEQPATGLLVQDDRHAVAEGVADELRAPHLASLVRARCTARQADGSRRPR